MHACVCACVCVCVCVCVLVNLCLRACKCGHKCACIRVFCVELSCISHFCVSGCSCSSSRDASLPTRPSSSCWPAWADSACSKACRCCSSLAGLSYIHVHRRVYICVCVCVIMCEHIREHVHMGGLSQLALGLAAAQSWQACHTHTQGTHVSAFLVHVTCACDSFQGCITHLNALSV